MRRFSLISLSLLFACTEGNAPQGQDAGAAVAPPSKESTSVSPNEGAAEAPTARETPTQPAAADGPEESPAKPADEPATPAVAEPAAPPDYGLIKPPEPAPDPADLTLHGMAGYEVVAVYEKPTIESKRMGFLRLGQRMKVTAKKGSEGCPKGWYGLPEGGFACASKGLVVGEKPPYLHAPPPPPELDSASPYGWAYVRRWNTPMYWRIPNAAEIAEATDQRAKLESERTGEPLPSDKPAAPAPAGDGGEPAKAEPAKAEPAKKEGDGPDLSKLPAPDGDKPAKAEPAKAEPAKEEPAKAAPTPEEPAEPEEEIEPIKLPLNPQHPWLEKGFFVSLGGSKREKGRSYWHTARGAWVEQAAAYKYEPKDFKGKQLDGDTPISFPVGFVMKKKGTPLFEKTESGDLKRAGKLDKRDFVDLKADGEEEIGGKTYVATTDGKLLRKDALRIPTLQPIPEGLEPYDRWIDVTLKDQILVAYEGETPVYTTLVSTGRKGSEEEPFDTPTGRWRIYSKQVTSNMDGTTATDGNYAIQDVPWVMYFEGSYALHGAFWHASFGHVRSHGCVNLGPSDARWLFFWTTPFLPEGWHGVNASDASPGTTVVVRP